MVVPAMRNVPINPVYMILKFFIMPTYCPLVIDVTEHPDKSIFINTPVNTVY